MKRTLAEARRTLEANAESLNPEMYARISGEITAAETEATRIANEYADERAEHFLSLRDELLEEACSVRDDYTALIAEGQQGELSAKAFHDRMEVLEDRKRRVARRQGELESIVAAVERIEENPAQWTDEAFYAKYHQLMPDFTF